MQPSKAQKGVFSKSELLDSLKVYLNNKNRLQPIIGLGSIVECVKVGAHNREALYLCEVCVCRLSKADMRNHIMGSLHRYNFIKAWHPHLVSEWKEKSDLSKLAWPLMEIAKTIEGKEGAGDVQLLEAEDAVYQRMATYSEKDAVTLINSLRGWQGQGEPESHRSQSQRIVLLGKNQRGWSEKSLKANMTSHKTYKLPVLMQSTVAPLIKAQGWLKNISASQFDNTQMVSEPSVLLEISNSFLDAGTKPLIGLSRVVECRSEDGRTHIFLCHCCRIKSNKKDIIDHLTSSSHLINYLMETHPEQMEVMTADINDNCHFLQSLAKKVEQEEGRGEMKVLNVPESLCILLTGKSYHWWSSMNKTSVEGKPERHAAVPSKRVRTKRKMMKVTNTVFKVSLPISKGSLLLERTSFSEDSLPMSYSHSSASDYIPSPESPTEDRELDCDTGSFAVNHTEHASECTTSQLQQDHHSGDAEDGQYLGPGRNITVTQYQDVDGYFRDNEYFSQSEDITVTKDQKVNGERNYDVQGGSQERSRKEVESEGLQKQNEWLSPALSHTHDWSSYNSSHRREEGYTEQWCSSQSGVQVSSDERQREMGSDATQHYYEQQPQNQYMVPYYTGLQTGSAGHHSLSGGWAPYLNAAWINMYPHLYSFAHSNSSAPQPGVHLTEKRQSHTYTEFTTSHVHTSPQSYMMQPEAYQPVQTGHVVTSNPHYSYGPRINPDQHFPYPDSSISSSGVGGFGGGGVMSQ